MDFCITRLEEAGGTRLSIDGEMGRQGLGELRRVLAASRGPITLDLGGLRVADEDALAALRALEAEGVRLTGASQYLELRLRSRRAPP
jgi:hypothetical protein